MRYLALAFLLLGLLAVSLAGFRGSTSRRPPLYVFPDMDRQPKLRPQAPNDFFGDGKSSRLPPAGAIARGASFQDVPFNTGFQPGTTNFVDSIPVPLTAGMLERGQERFGIYCAPCHSPVGDGNSAIRQFGMAVVANLHDPRIVQMPDGELFYIVTHGRNLMGSYADKLNEADRWAVIAYLRALQLSRLAFDEDLPEQARARMNEL